MALSISNFFRGCTESKYSQVTHLEMVPGGYIVDGVFNQTTIYRNLYTSKTTERRFLFEGVPGNLIPSTGSVSVTDANGQSYSVSFDNIVVDGSSGTAVLEKESNQVTVSPYSPHLRTVEVVHKSTTHYCNNVQIV